MSRIGKIEDFKALVKVLLSSFVGAFMGSVWLAYGSIQLGASENVWIPLSGVGAMMVCGLMLFLSRPYVRAHIFHH